MEDSKYVEGGAINGRDKKRIEEENREMERRARERDKKRSKEEGRTWRWRRWGEKRRNAEE